MSFNSQAPRVEYTASTGQAVFTFLFKIYNESDIVIYQTLEGIPPDDDTDLLTLTTDYTVAIDGDNGGAVTLNTATTGADAITILRSLPQTRDVDYQTNGDLLADTLDADQDYQTYLIADNVAISERAMTLSQNSQNVSNYFPTPSSLRGVRWNLAGSALENVTLDGVANILNADTISDLLQVSVALYETVNIKGYNSKNDGGGDIFNYDSTIDKSTANGGTIIDPDQTLSNQGNGVGTGCWVRQLEGNINYNMFGAYGDGIHDDTIAINKAFASNDNGGTVDGIAGNNYLITDVIEVRTRHQASANHRYYLGNGCTITQDTDNTPIFQLKGPTTNVTVKGFTATYTNPQPATNLNAAIFQMRDSTAEEYGSNGAGVRFALWDCVFEDIFSWITNYPASMFSYKDETYVDVNEPSHIWGCVFRNFYGFPSRRAIFGGVGGAAGLVVNSIENCLFFGQNAGTVEFLVLAQWTESAIRDTEILVLDSDTTDIVRLDGCINMIITNFRMEDCVINADNKAFILTTGANMNYTFDALTITNCITKTTNDAYGVRGFSSKNIFRKMAVSGSSSIDVQSGTFYMFTTDDDGSAEYTSDLYTNLLTVDPTSNSYLYKQSADFDKISSPNVTVQDYASAISGGGVVETPEFVIANKDGYLIETTFSIDSSVGVDLFPKTLINGVEAYNAGLTTGNTNAIKGFSPIWKDAILISKGDKLSFSVDANSNSRNVSCSFAIFEYIQKV